MYIYIYSKKKKKLVLFYLENHVQYFLTQHLNKCRLHFKAHGKSIC